MVRSGANQVEDLAADSTMTTAIMATNATILHNETVTGAYTPLQVREMG